MPRMPQVTARELVRFLKSQGFVEDRQAGSHLTLWHDGAESRHHHPNAHGRRHRPGEGEAFCCLKHLR
jgi:predicted RNA binding protein YcfA (HicA-like mRNA interferase family)